MGRIKKGEIPKSSTIVKAQRTYSEALEIYNYKRQSEAMKKGESLSWSAPKKDTPAYEEVRELQKNTTIEEYYEIKLLILDDAYQAYIKNQSKGRDASSK